MADKMYNFTLYPLMWKFAFVLFFLLQQTFIWGQSVSKTAHLGPVPQFSAFKLCHGDTAQFINQTHDGITFKWVLSTLDTTNNTQQRIDSATSVNYQYFFNLQGIYILTLEADNGHLASISRTLAVNSDTKAIFDFMTCINQFVNISTCANQFFWDFGDSTTSTLLMPIHQYADTGVFPVKLVAMKAANIDSAKTPLSIYQLGYQSPLFTSTLSANIYKGKLLDSLGPYFFVTWDFGDGSPIDTTREVTHAYPNADASYFVSVYTGNACGKASMDTVIQIWSTVGLEKLKLENVVVQPNPFEEYFHIQGADNCDFTIYNSLAQPISKGKISSADFEHSGLKNKPPGAYTLVISNSTTRKTFKLLKLQP